MIQLVDFCSQQELQRDSLGHPLSMFPKGRGRESRLRRFSQGFKSKSSYFSSVTSLFLPKRNPIRVRACLEGRDPCGRNPLHIFTGLSPPLREPPPLTPFWEGSGVFLSPGSYFCKETPDLHLLFRRDSQLLILITFPPPNKWQISPFLLSALCLPTGLFCSVSAWGSVPSGDGAPMVFSTRSNGHACKCASHQAFSPEILSADIPNPELIPHVHLIPPVAEHSHLCS